MRTDRLGGLAALSLAAASAFALPATAQYAGDPFFEWTAPESRALALEVIATKLQLARTFAPPFDDELVERFEAMAGPDWARFGGTLEAANPDLADELREALEAVGEAAEEGEATAELAGVAEGLLAQAYVVVIPAEIRDAPAFKGAMLVELLLAEGGVAEGYEEALENVWEYPGGWAALQRVDALWSEVAPLASDERRADGEEMLVMLHALFPDAGPPEATTGWNPEEAEAPAQRLGGIIEDVVNANLYPGREFARLAGHLSDVTADACEDYDSGNDEIAAESIAAVATLYAAHLSDTVNVFAAEENEEAEELFSALVVVGDDDDDEGDAVSEADDDETEAAAAGSPAETCRSLSETLLEVRGVFGG